MSVAIFTFHEDLHGHLVADHIRRLGQKCSLIETDRLAYRPSLSWSSEKSNAALWDSDDNLVEPRSLATIWWRRVAGPAAIQGQGDEAERALVSSECRTALAGTVHSRFKGRWVNNPSAEVTADNKICQLTAARAAGFLIPATLISSEPSRVREFVASRGGCAVVKAVRGTAAFSIPARRVTADDLTSDRSIEACPAIYQEVVGGSVHLRIHVFGETVIAVRIVSDHLDWRPDMQVPMERTNLSSELCTRLVDFVHDLGLAMGIIDAKIRGDGALVFLEINPQGQFLFIEGITGAPLAETMATFLSE